MIWDFVLRPLVLGPILLALVYLALTALYLVRYQAKYALYGHGEKVTIRDVLMFMCVRMGSYSRLQHELHQAAKADPLLNGLHVRSVVVMWTLIVVLMTTFLAEIGPRPATHSR